MILSQSAKGDIIIMINLEKEIREQPRVLASLAEVNKDAISALASEMKAKNIHKIYFAARGTSDHAATYAQYLFALVCGIPCGLATPSVISKYGAKVDYSDSLVIGISQSGAAEDVIAVISDAKASGALTAGITNITDSHLAKSVDFLFDCHAGAETSIAATKTFTAQMMILALIAAEISGNEALKSGLSEVSGAMDELLSYMPETLAVLTAKYTDMTAATTLGRGFAYPIALEGALKILETNCIKVRGYAISDFHHGPIAQIHGGDPVFVISLEGAVTDDTDAMIARLKNIGADIIVVSDSDKYCDDDTVTTLKIPHISARGISCDALNVFTAAAVFQLFACKLAENRGIDPDVSKTLKKITVTV